MIILSTPGWQDYELLDTGNGQRLERFGKYTLIRPDPQIIWKPKLDSKIWDRADAIFKRTSQDKGLWLKKNPVPNKWLMRYKDLTFYSKLTPFKHTGLFPEQVLQWDFIQEKISSSKRPINLLNLFGYTGLASLAAASAGAKVTHVDASYPTIGWARDNQKISGLENKPIRWILDDASKFVQREIKRSVKYDAIIMDPPIFGHGPKGEIWDFNKSFPKLLEMCQQILTSQPLFIIINAYAISASSLMLENILKDFTQNYGGKVESGELAIQEKTGQRLLSTGIFARWSS